MIIISKNIRSAFLPVLAVCLILAVFSTSCSKKIENHVEYIPADAAGVLAFDVQQITLKVAWETITDMGAIKMLFERFRQEDETPGQESVENLLSDPKAYGFDLLNQYFLFMGHTDEQQYVAAIIPLDDESELETQLEKEGKQIQKGKGIQYAAFGEGLIGWKNGMSVFIATKDKATLLPQLESIFQKKHHTLFADNENFRKLIEQSADITMWGSMEKMAESNKLNEATTTASMASNVDPEELKNTYYNSVLNFNDGEIKWDFSYYMNEQNLADYNRIVDKKFNREILTKIPGKSVIAAGGGAVNVNKLWEKMKEEEQDEALKAYAQLLNFNIEDIFTLFEGDVVLAIHKLDPILPLPELVLGASVNSVAKLDSLIEKYDGYLLDKGNYHTLRGGWGVNLIRDGNFVFLVRGKELTNRILSGKVAASEALAPDHQSRITDNKVMFYVDVKRLTDGLNNSMLASEEIQKINAEIKDLEFVAPPLSGNVARATLTLRFHKADQNSLFTLLKMFLEEPEEEVAS